MLLLLAHCNSSQYGNQFDTGLSMKDIDSVSDSASNAEFDPGVRKIPWSREWQPTPVFLSGEFHSQRSLAAYSAEGHKESEND